MSDKDYDRWLKRARDEMFPKLKDSAMQISILTGDPDPKMCVELGAAILFDKPIIVWVPRDMKVPVNLKRVATHIIQGDVNDPSDVEELKRAIRDVRENDARAKQ
jgi:hypothetical protein